MAAVLPDEAQTRPPDPVHRAWVERHAALLLLGVFLLGVVTRLYPLLPYAVWGSDTGEYHYLTERLLATGRIDFEYAGWGLAYPYFPGMFVLTGAVVATTGLDLFTALLVVVPVVAGLIPVGVALVAERVTGDARVGVLAGFFIALTGAHVIVTSHAMPGTLGHVFLAALLLILLEAYRHPRAAVPLLAVAGAALVLTHHLTHFFAVGAIAGSAFLREFGARRTRWERLRVEIPLTLGLVAAAAVWWLGISGPFRDRIVGDLFELPWWLNAALFGAALLALPGVVALKRRVLPGLTWRARLPSLRGTMRLAIATVTGVALAIVLFIVFGIPGTTLTASWASLLYALPPIAFLAFALPGAGMIRYHRDGFLVHGWLFALLASLAFALATGSRVLFPYRHVDYIFEPAAIAMAAAVVALADVWTRANPRPRRAATVATALVVALLVANAATSQPPRETVGGFEEGVYDAEWAAVQWAQDHLPEGATVAADHRISSLLFGFAGANPTWDEAFRTYHSETAEEALADLRSMDIAYGAEQRIDYVFLSPVLREGVILVQWDNARPMTDAAWGKFFDSPYFEPVYEDPENDVHLFRVAWERVGEA